MTRRSTIAPPLRPSVYVFRDAEGRCTYVGKALRNPGDRIKAHFDARAPHALEAASIELTWFPHGFTDRQLLAVEEAQIRAMRPPSNKVHNGRHHDRVWAHRVRRAHLVAAGEPLPWGDGVRLAWEVVVARARAGGRLVVGLVVVDVMLRLVVALAAQMSG